MIVYMKVFQNGTIMVSQALKGLTTILANLKVQHALWYQVLRMMEQSLGERGTDVTLAHS